MHIPSRAAKNPLTLNKPWLDEKVVSKWNEFADSTGADTFFITNIVDKIVVEKATHEN